MSDWLSPGIVIGLIANLATIAFLWGKMNANMANLGEQMGKISQDFHEISRSVSELGKWAAATNAKVENHERQIANLDNRSRGEKAG